MISKTRELSYIILVDFFSFFFDISLVVAEFYWQANVGGCMKLIEVFSRKELLVDAHKEYLFYQSNHIDNSTFFLHSFQFERSDFPFELRKTPQIWQTFQSENCLTFAEQFARKQTCKPEIVFLWAEENPKAFRLLSCEVGIPRIFLLVDPKKQLTSELRQWMALNKE